MGWSQEQKEKRFKENLSKYDPDGNFEPLETFKDNATKMNFRHKPCGSIISIKPSNLFEGLKKKRNCCKKCTSNAMKLSYESVKSNIEAEGFILLTPKEEYENTKQKLKIKCNNKDCRIGYFFMRYNDFEKGHRCSWCNGGGAKYTLDMVKSLMYEKVGDDFKILSEEYINSSTPLLIQHKCGCIFKNDWNHFNTRDHDWCPKCHSSKGEAKIHMYLQEHNYEFERQYTFDDCKNINKLPFDFYIPLYNLIIEFDGIQHYEKNRSFFKDNDKFEQLQRNDQIKNKYCEDNGINILRIPYWDIDNIESILDEYLAKFND